VTGTSWFVCDQRKLWPHMKTDSHLSFMSSMTFVMAECLVADLNETLSKCVTFAMMDWETRLIPKPVQSLNKSLQFIRTGKEVSMPLKQSFLVSSKNALRNKRGLLATLSGSVLSDLDRNNHARMDQAVKDAKEAELREADSLKEQIGELQGELDKFLADNARLEVDEAIEINMLHTRHETQTMCLAFFLQFQRTLGCSINLLLPALCRLFCS
jgi:hypothetical protein